MAHGGLAAALITALAIAPIDAKPVKPRPRPTRRSAASWDERLGKPRNIVIVAVVAACGGSAGAENSSNPGGRARPSAGSKVTTWSWPISKPPHSTAALR